MFIDHPGQPLTTPNDLSFQVGLGFIFDNVDFDLGVRYGHKLAEAAFIPSLNNSVVIDSGAFLSMSHRYYNNYYHNYYTDSHLSVPILLRWDFHVHPEWTVYPMLGLNFHLVSERYFSNERHSNLYLDLAGGIGAMYHFSKKYAFRFDFERGFEAVHAGITVKL